MCGIAGIFSLSNQPFAGKDNVRWMANAMQHRGPNGMGFFTGFKQPQAGIFERNPIEGDAREADVFLAHRRLAIIDLSHAAEQPMSSDDKRYWITYNGEIYNFQDIASELIALGHSIQSRSDTEILLKAYQQWGRDCLPKLNGMFAFAVWDDQKKTLFCARDRIGIKPFYYTIQKQKFIFASDIKTLIASKCYQPDLDVEGLYHAMSFGVAPRPMTCFKQVQALPQAHWMLIDRDGNIITQRYWQVPVGTQNKAMQEDTAIELIHHSLEQSIKRRLVADVPVGTFMSGGVDSTLISALAARQHGGIKAFTLGFEDCQQDFNEIEEAKATAQLHEMDHIIDTIRLDSILEHIDDNIRTYEEPFYSLSPNFLIAKLVARHGLTVVLNGLGGDELFAGYRHFRWAKRVPYLRMLAPLLLPFQRYQEKIARISEFRQADHLGKYHSLLSAIMSEHLKKNLFNLKDAIQFNTYEKLHQLYCDDNLAFEDGIEAMSYMNLVNYIGNHHVYRVDQFTMLFSLEGRFPFLDHEVIAAAFQIPSHLKIKQGQQKYILRQAAKPFIAPACLAMKKKGFSLPMAHWLRHDLRDYAQNHLEQLAERDIFCSNAVKSVWPKFLSGELDYRPVWQLVATEAWLTMYFGK